MFHKTHRKSPRKLCFHGNPHYFFYATPAQYPTIYSKSPSQQFKLRNKEFVDKSNIAAADQKRSNTLRHEVFSHADNRSKVREVNERIDLTLAAYDRDLNNRRERLRQLLQADEQEIAEQLAKLEGLSQNQRWLEMRSGLGEKLAQKESLRKELCHQKLLQQCSEMSEEVRLLLSKNVLLDSKQAQLQQIEDKKKMEDVDKITDVVWEGVLNKGREAWRRREEQNKANKAAIDLSCTRVLDQQVADLAIRRATSDEEKAKEIERKEAVDIALKIRQDEDEYNKRKKESQMNVSESLMAQIREKAERNHLQKVKDRNVDEVMILVDKSEQERDRNATSELKMSSTKEALMYLDYLKGIQKEKALQLESEDAVLNEYREVEENKALEVRRNVLRASKELQQDAYRECDRQLASRQIQRSLENEMKLREDAIFKLKCEGDIQMLADNKRRLHDEKLARGRDLKQQMLEQQRIANDSKMLEDKVRQMEILADMEKEALRKEALNAAKIMPQPPLHPFTRVIEETCICSSSKECARCMKKYK